jgi:hemolysin activation/secretion protein
LLVTILYDDVEINQLEEDGLRAKLRVGPNITSGRSHSLAELEAFYYRMLPLAVNFAGHAFFGQSTLNEVSSLYFLGGFDSVRGLPDGIAYGTRTGYLNLELRHVSLKRKYFWLQPVLFADAGSAGPEWQMLRDDIRSSAGAGLRIAIPQVYRLIFRIDYAVSTDGSGSRGITAGMNQFFDPYRPL